MGGETRGSAVFDERKALGQPPTVTPDSLRGDGKVSVQTIAGPLWPGDVDYIAISILMCICTTGTILPAAIFSGSLVPSAA